MPTIESPIAGSLLVWKDVKVAISNAMNKGVPRTMGECMQAAVIAKLFPGLTEGEQLQLRSKIIKVEPIFEHHANAHVDDLMNQYNVDRNAPGDGAIEPRRS